MLKNRFKILFTGLFVLFAACTATKPWVSDEYENWREEAPDPSASLEHSLFLIGDTGEPVLDGEDPVLILLEKKLKEAGDNSSIIFLGDNIYSDGLEPAPDDARKVAEAKLTKTLSSMHDYGGKAFFVAGNHDWYSNFEGLQLQEEFINSYGKVENIGFYPRSGCPGPDEVIINDRLALALLDSEWFLTEGAREYARNENCRIQTTDDAMVELRRLAFKHKDKTLVVAVHHPFHSNGRHGGYFTAKQHFFPLTDINKKLWVPLPGLGSLYVLLRNLGVSDEDFGSKTNKAYRENIINAIDDHPNAITAAGHDHNLQYFEVEGITHVVSGSGSKTSKARKGKNAGFVFSNKGFLVLNFYNDGTIWAEYLTPVKPYAGNNPIFRAKVKSSAE